MISCGAAACEASGGVPPCRAPCPPCPSRGCGCRSAACRVRPGWSASIPSRTRHPRDGSPITPCFPLSRRRPESHPRRRDGRRRLPTSPQRECRIQRFNAFGLRPIEIAAAGRPRSNGHPRGLQSFDLDPAAVPSADGCTRTACGRAPPSATPPGPPGGPHPLGLKGRPPLGRRGPRAVVLKSRATPRRHRHRTTAVPLCCPANRFGIAMSRRRGRAVAVPRRRTTGGGACKSGGQAVRAGRH